MGRDLGKQTKSRSNTETYRLGLRVFGRSSLSAHWCGYATNPVIWRCGVTRSSASFKAHDTDQPANKEFHR